MLAKLVSLKDHLADLPPDSEAFSTLDETIEILQERNHKIPIADSSEVGWLAVKHYESNPLLLNEDNDKKFRAAERQALRDQVRQRKKRNVEGFAFRNRQAQPFFSLTQGISTGASVLGNSHSRSLPLRQTNTFPQLTTNSPEGLVNIAVFQATGGRSARSVSQGFTSAAHLASCQP